MAACAEHGLPVPSHNAPPLMCWHHQRMHARLKTPRALRIVHKDLLLKGSRDSMDFFSNAPTNLIASSLRSIQLDSAFEVKVV